MKAWCNSFSLFISSLPLCSFIKTWKVANNGDDRWPEGCCLVFSGGVNLASHTTVPVTSLNPNESVDISVDMVSPSEAGIYESKWQMATPNGSYFGGNSITLWLFIYHQLNYRYLHADTIWVILSVAEGGTLALTQQLTHFNALGSVIPNSQPFNPFSAQNNVTSRLHHLQQDDTQMGS